MTNVKLEQLLWLAYTARRVNELELDSLQDDFNAWLNRMYVQRLIADLQRENDTFTLRNGESLTVLTTVEMTYDGQYTATCRRQ